MLEDIINSLVELGFPLDEAIAMANKEYFEAIHQYQQPN